MKYAIIFALLSTSAFAQSAPTASQQFVGQLAIALAQSKDAEAALQAQIQALQAQLKSPTPAPDKK